ncbi:MAG: hypothetical protein V2G42_03190 [bacterium JZ-2024 1]
MKPHKNTPNGKKKEGVLSWMGEIFAPPAVSGITGSSRTSERKLLSVAPVTRDEADKVVDFFHRKEGDILLFLNDTADPKLMTAMRFYFEHKQKTEGLGWMLEIVPERAYLILSERPKLLELHVSEEGVSIREVGAPGDGALESDHSGDHPGTY